MAPHATSWPRADVVVLCLAGSLGCDRADPPTPTATAAPTPADARAVDARPVDSAATAAPPPAPTFALPSSPLGEALYAENQSQLLALLPARPETAMPFLTRSIDVGGPGTMNQGNPAIAHHGIDKATCRAGLRHIQLQTDAQRARCGHDYMVPIYPDGDVTKTTHCIDIFEFPNRPCELPFVWSGATQAKLLCQKLGKRLCTQEEWMFACAGDPAGGKEQRYAYGDALDLAKCNTEKAKKRLNRDVDGEVVPCNPHSIHTAWDTCSTNTEPSGSFPECRSRFGVFDLHGNVAEAMTRWDAEEQETVSQLKGSAFFYVDVAVPEGGERKKENYPDWCRHDPRWHVQSMHKAWHVNYHLGFRCCADVAKPSQ